MKVMTKILVAINALLLSPVSFGQTSKSLPDKVVPSNFESIEVDEMKEATTLSIKVDKETKNKSLQLTDHGSFLQLDLQDTLVPKPGDFIEGAGPYVSKVGVFQVKPTVASIRIFVKNTAGILKKATSVEVLKDIIIISIDHKKAAELLSGDPRIAASNKKQIEEVVAQTKVDRSIPAPASQVTESDSALSFLNISSDSMFKKSLVKVSVYLAALLAVLLITVMAKPYLRKKHQTSGSNASQALETLATHSITSKQKLQLIRIGSQKILIGVTPENIQFLTNINPEPPTPTIQNPKVAPARQIKPKKARPQQTISTTKSNPPKKVPKIKQKPAPQMSQTAINDVTNLIRQKLKNLPNV